MKLVVGQSWRPKSDARQACELSSAWRQRTAVSSAAGFAGRRRFARGRLHLSCVVQSWHREGIPQPVEIRFVDRMKCRINHHGTNNPVQKRRARLASEPGLLAMLIEEMNGRGVGRMTGGQHDARERPDTQQVFSDSFQQGRLTGKIRIEAQGRFTHRARPPLPPAATCAQNKNGSNALWEPL